MSQDQAQRPRFDQAVIEQAQAFLQALTENTPELSSAAIVLDWNLKSDDLPSAAFSGLDDITSVLAMGRTMHSASSGLVENMVQKLVGVMDGAGALRPSVDGDDENADPAGATPSPDRDEASAGPTPAVDGG